MGRIRRHGQTSEEGNPVKPLIFAVEDDTAIQEVYAYTLENEFDCRCFDNGAAFFAATERDGTPDLILLDVMLPGEDGFAILSQLKNTPATARVPVIMVSAKGEEIAKVKGLNLGADDYLSKPFGVLELVARIKANLRKITKPPASAVYKNIAVDAAKHQITAGGHPLQLTLKEYNLLCLLCENAGTVQTRETIFAVVWGDTFVGETRTLDIHIQALRRKLAEAASGGESDGDAAIQTVRGVGYMLI